MNNEYHPDWVSPPGETIRDMLEERGETLERFALRIGITVEAVSDLLEGKIPLTRAIALQLQETLVAPAGFWVARERLYREALERKDPR